mmetsp:Transcript_122161/g.182487  ORF Transcript_122161/g.182487 Transcript_122161/m.182487 type:complete len:208 (+) Transcript_122161:292-915(+)
MNGNNRFWCILLLIGGLLVVVVVVVGPCRLRQQQPHGIDRMHDDQFVTKGLNVDGLNVEASTRNTTDRFKQSSNRFDADVIAVKFRNVVIEHVKYGIWSVHVGSNDAGWVFGDQCNVGMDEDGIVVFFFFLGRNRCIVNNSSFVTATSSSRFDGLCFVHRSCCCCWRCVGGDIVGVVLVSSVTLTIRLFAQACFLFLVGCCSRCCSC